MVWYDALMVWYACKIWCPINVLWYGYAYVYGCPINVLWYGYAYVWYDAPLMYYGMDMHMYDMMPH